jgi:hypothetical protein
VLHAAGLRQSASRLRQPFQVLERRAPAALAAARYTAQRARPCRRLNAEWRQKKRDTVITINKIRQEEEKAAKKSSKRIFAESVDRTRDLQIFSLTLSQLSYLGYRVFVDGIPAQSAGI